MDSDNYRDLMKQLYDISNTDKDDKPKKGFRLPPKNSVAPKKRKKKK